MYSDVFGVSERRMLQAMIDEQRNSNVLAVAGITAAIGVAAPAYPDAALRETSPSDGAQLIEIPQVRLSFNEKLHTQFTTIKITTSSDKDVPVTQAVTDDPTVTQPLSDTPQPRPLHDRLPHRLGRRTPRLRHYDLTPAGPRTITVDRLSRRDASGGHTVIDLEPGSALYGIAAAPYGGIWFTAQGLSKIGRVTAMALLSAYGVTIGAGTRMIETNAYMDVSNSGQIYVWSSRYLGGSPSGYSGRFTDAKVTAGDSGYWLLTSAGQIYAYGDAPYLGGGAAGHTGDLAAVSGAETVPRMRARWVRRHGTSSGHDQ